MQNVVVAKPYQFIPPRRSNLVPSLLQMMVPFYLRRWHGITQVTCRGVERLRESIQQGHGILLTPNHCRPCDPMVVGRMMREAGQHLYIMASWHLFMQSPIQRWLLPLAGAFSVHREGTDRDALSRAAELLSRAERPLLIFPEGVISRSNDRLNNLMEGSASIARLAARMRTNAQAHAGIVIHPVAIRYRFHGNLEKSLNPVLEGIETRLTWRPQRELPLVPRVLKLGTAMLALKEIEYFGEPQPGPLDIRVQKLVDCLLTSIERQWLKETRHGDVVWRVKSLRKVIVARMRTDTLSPEEYEQHELLLADLTLAQQLAFYPAGYFEPTPTPERILETVERFEEDTTDVARIHRPMQAIVDVGEAIPVSPTNPTDSEGENLMAQVRTRLHDMLQASLTEACPGAAMHGAS